MQPEQMQSPKIAMLTPFADVSNANQGPLVHVVKLSEFISDRRDIVLTLISFSESTKVESLGGLSIIKIRYRRLYRYLPFLPVVRLALTLLSTKPDLVHVQGGGLNSYLFCGLFLIPHRVPRIITIHGHAAAEGVALGNMKEGAFRLSLLRWADRQIARRFDRIVCVTSSLKKEFGRTYGIGALSKLVVIPNGVESVAHTTEGVTDMGKDRVDHSSGVFTILTAKALAPWNGQEYLIKAFATVAKKVPKARLILAGGGPDKTRLTETVHQLGLDGNVTFLGQVPHSSVARLLSGVTLAVVPSVQIAGVVEGSSIFLLEAMAAGRPVIATSVGGNSESVVDGKTGVLVPEGDSDAIAEAILDLYANPGKAARIGAAAHDYVKGERSWSRIAECYAQLYSEVIAERIEVQKQQDNH